MIGFSAPVARADCDPIGAEALPPSGTVLPTNAQLVLSFGSEHLTLDEVTLALVAESDEVPLVVVDSFSSSSLTQFLVRPERELQPATTYRLVVQAAFRLTGQDAMEHWSWPTSAGPVLTEPTWEDPPSVLSRGYSDDCCGRVAAGILTPVVDGSELILVVFGVEPEPWSGPGQHVVPIQSGQALVGRSGCSGGFGFNLVTEYRIDLAAFDLAGNRAEAPGNGLLLQFSDIGICGSDCD